MMHTALAKASDKLNFEVSMYLEDKKCEKFFLGFKIKSVLD